MTKPCYHDGCAASSEESGIALSAPADAAWIVNFNSGNANWNNHNNDYHARAVRSGECQGAVAFSDLHSAWREARRGKTPSLDQLAFDAEWIDRLFDLRDDLNAGTWAPSPPTCFIASAPKAREIHAPAFSDRVVHHYLVPRLDQIFEPVFIHDSFANRTGKGTHAAVARVRQFIREVHSGQGGGYYLQLDIRNFFNRIHRPTLYGLLKPRMERAGLALPSRQAVHALVSHSVRKTGVIRAWSPEERGLVPDHKRLENAPPGCGIAIGNLSSQFFANVYLNELDQFLKHILGARRYLRYVDDFVLIHRDREQLQAWQVEIERFLADRLQLELKPGPILRPLSAGIDFLGYVIYPRHLVVRRRVIGHARAKLAAWESRHVHGGCITRDGDAVAGVRSVWASYQGHFRHANSFRLRARFHDRFRWLSQLEN
jgi:RNA-directed DNA polymerase